MNFPSIQEVNQAKIDRLSEWYRRLPYPTNDEQRGILDRVNERCAQCGFPDAAFNNLARRSTSIHEAAHAVVAIRLGLQVNYVEITSPEEGECQTEGKSVSEKSVVVDMAGQWAETQFCKQGFRRLCSHTDEQNAAASLAVIYRGQTKEYQRQVHDRIHSTVVSLVEKNRQSIERVAENLRAKGKLTGEQVKNLSLTAD